MTDHDTKTVLDLSHDEAQELDNDEIKAHASALREAADLDEIETITIELTPRMALDISRMAQHLLETWEDGEYDDPAYMRHAACLVYDHMVNKTAWDDEYDTKHELLEAFSSYGEAIDEVRE